MRDLQGQPTIIVWPKGAPGTTFTPSPIVDALSRTSAELENTRARLNADTLIKEDKKSKSKSKAGEPQAESKLGFATDNIHQPHPNLHYMLLMKMVQRWTILLAGLRLWRQAMQDCRRPMQSCRKPTLVWRRDSRPWSWIKPVYRRM
jgi:hypothetical protein